MIKSSGNFGERVLEHLDVREKLVDRFVEATKHLNEKDKLLIMSSNTSLGKLSDIVKQQENTK